MRVPDGHAGVVLRAGHYHRTVAAGRHYLWPGTERIIFVDLGQQTLTVHPAVYQAAEGRSVRAEARVRLRVVDPTVATLKIMNYRLGVEQLAHTALRNLISQQTVAESRAGLRSLAASVLDALRQTRWGIEFDAVELTSLVEQREPSTPLGGTP